MIEKMKFLSITGPREDIDRVAQVYLSKYEIHLENALSELKTVKDLRPYIETNPYKEELAIARELTASLGGGEQRESVPGELPMDANEAAVLVRGLRCRLQDLEEKKAALVSRREALEKARDQVFHFEGLDYALKPIMNFKFIKFRFGRIPRDYYEKFSAYVYKNIDSILFKCGEDEASVWVVYFVPNTLVEKIDAIYASMHFERFHLDDVYDGTPQEAVKSLDGEIQTAESELKEAENEIGRTLAGEKEEILAAAASLETFAVNFDVRKLAACTHHESHNFYILCGWMAQKDAARFQKELEGDEKTFCIFEDDRSHTLSAPPTKMKNPGLFKPFEMYVEMYGLPSYNEIDPTILIGLTYSILFGFMFGDAGQGLCLLAGGLLLYRLKKVRLAGIISCCGFFSTIFGFLFGSVFGFENVIEPLWLRPQQAMTDLPFIGRLNTVFVVAVAIGMGIILMCMVLNIINSLRSRDAEKAWFDTNGAAGLVFYLALASVIVLYMSGRALPATAVLVVMFVIPLGVIFFKEPLAAMVEKRAKKEEGSLGMFITQGLFELFEVLLSYFSNTLSFVRVGAFAVSHAAMMEVVLMLAGAESGGSLNWAVVVGGNLFVIGMEGLIVGIQVLRLEYYELFSRFYRGGGRTFEPYGRTAQR